MASTPQQYDPGLVTANFDGLTFDDYAPGTFINIEANGDRWVKEVGSNGRVARVRNRDASARVTLTILATSPLNALLSAKFKRDQAFGDGAGSIQVKDLLGTSKFNGAVAWIVRDPTQEYGNNAPTRQWMFDVAEGKFDQ